MEDKVKQMLGELVWTNLILQEQLEAATKQIEELNKKVEEKSENIKKDVK